MSSLAPRTWPCRRSDLCSQAQMSKNCSYITFTSTFIAASNGSTRDAPPSPNCFICMQFSANILPNNRLTHPPLGLALHLGNPHMPAIMQRRFLETDHFHFFIQDSILITSFEFSNGRFSLSVVLFPNKLQCYSKLLQNFIKHLL